MLLMATVEVKKRDILFSRNKGFFLMQHKAKRQHYFYKHMKTRYVLIFHSFLRLTSHHTQVVLHVGDSLIIIFFIKPCSFVLLREQLQ